METYYTDLLSIGAGLAGERVAVEVASRGFKAICLSIVPPPTFPLCRRSRGYAGLLRKLLHG